MTRHTLRDLMIGLQGALFSMALANAVFGEPIMSIPILAFCCIALLCTPSRLPPRNERGQFSKRD